MNKKEEYTLRVEKAIQGINCHYPVTEEIIEKYCKLHKVKAPIIKEIGAFNLIDKRVGTRNMFNERN